MVRVGRETKGRSGKGVTIISDLPLDEKGIPYSDYGVWAMADWYQVFLQDPDGNIVEVHQTGMR